MRNLILSSDREYSISGLNLEASGSSQKFLVVDQLRTAVFIQSDGKIYRFLTEDESVVEVFSVHNYYSNEDEIPSIVSMCYFQVTDSLCVATDKGELLNIPCSTPEDVECAGFVESGLKLMEPSPDEDVMVLLTFKDTVITMTASFDPINEVDLFQEDFGEKQFITVGWGKKETQFHGSEGKGAAHTKPIGPSVPLAMHDKGQPQISWRGDGALFAVNCINQAKGERFVRIFDRKGDLMYTSEHIPGLEGVLSWRPLGNIMACTQHLPNKHVVCFLEKNGLRHGDFTLPFSLDTVEVRQLSWNAESTLLLAWCQVLRGATPPAGLVVGQSFLLLWSVNNYHWYLKQRIDLTLEDSPLAICWDLESGNCLHIICASAKYLQYDFSWRVDHSFGIGQNDGAYVGVIDGDSLLMTSFRQNVIPPPMCGTTLKLPAPALEVVFAPQNVPTSVVKEVEDQCLNNRSAEDSGFGDLSESLCSNPNNFCVMLSNGQFAAFSHVGGPQPNPSHILTGTYQLQWTEEKQAIPNRYLHHWTWISRDTLLCSVTVGSASDLCVFEMDSVGSGDSGRIFHRKTLTLPSTIVSIAQGTEGHNALIQLMEGKVLNYSNETGLLSNLFTFPHPVLKMVACRVDKDKADTAEIILGLSNHNRLYANSDLVMSNVTSVELHSQFLLLTTSQQQLFCCPLNKAALVSLSKSCTENGSSFGVVGRKVERGSRLVIVVPDGNRVILQMPRGNLECIEPRALSLSQLAMLLNSQLYHEAFDLARKQRINLNLFVDHNAQLFLKNIDLFVKRVYNPHWLCLFLAELHNEDCATTMYKSHYPDSRTASPPNKVNTVCEAFLTAVSQLDQKEAARLTLPVLTALVLKQSPDGLETALTLIKTLKESEEKSENDVPWTTALRHLLYLRDVNQLMDAALGMYDFNLVILVASKSQKDPKEYLAFLNKLRQMEKNYQRYSIDKHLRKWVSALHHLIKCPDDHEDEFLQFVINQGLHKEALAALPKSDERFRMIASAYADKLASQRLYKEAAVMYRRANDFHNALLSHQKALAWRSCIEDANAAGFSEDECKELFSELTVALQEAGQYGEAALILQNYLQEPQEAVRVLCLGHLWPEAQRVANAHLIKDSMETVIHPRVLDYAETLCTQIETLAEQFHTHTIRLSEVRREKQLARERQEAQDGDADGFGESDLLSDTSSMTGSSLSSKASSGHSSGSNRSSKNRRKQERKVLSLKKGSPHEELALMYALHQGITAAFALREEVNAVNCTLVELGNDPVAGDLQNLLCQTLKSMESRFSIIWPSSLTLGNYTNSSLQAFGPNATSNMLASTMSSVITNQLDLTLLEPTYRFPPVIRTTKWELDMLKREPK